MRAISLWQPWASLVAAGVKGHETRGWTTAYRGPLAIHAAKRWTRGEIEFINEIMDVPSIRTALSAMDIRCTKQVPLGAIVAVADLIYVESTAYQRSRVSDDDRLLGDWSDGRFAWGLTKVVPFYRPIPAKGRQGFWQWDHARYFDTNRWKAIPQVQEIQTPVQQIKQICGQMGILCANCRKRDVGPCGNYFVVAEIKGMVDD